MTQPAASGGVLTPFHPVVAEYFELADVFTAQVDRYLRLLSQLSATGADGAKTVAVTLNSKGGVEDVWLQPGCKHLGAEVISERLNEALQKAAGALEKAKAGIDADHSRELAVLKERNDYLSALIGAGPLPAVDEPDEPDVCASLSMPAVTVSDPAGSIFVTMRSGNATQIVITPVALNAVEADLVAGIVEVARCSYARSRAMRADRLVAEVVALGGSEDECRRYLPSGNAA